MWSFPQRFSIAVINENRATACGMCTINITPSIAHEIALAQIDFMSSGGAQEHARFWFSAIARLPVFIPGMEADFDTIEKWDLPPQLHVHRFDGCLGLSSASHIGLVGNGNEQEPGRLQTGARFRNAIIKIKLRDTHRRIGTSLSDHRTVQNSIAIEKDCAPPHFVLSHLVCAILSAGWETNRCHTTA